jgi:N-acyl homoserine lactone hydrolase
VLTTMLALLTIASSARTEGTDPAAADVRLYALDCGHATLDDGGVASDTGELDHRRLELANPCFVVRHPRGWLIWDTGLSPDAPAVPGLRVRPGPPLEGQLATIGVSPGTMTFVAFSHLHFDHAGNAGLFQRATWILNRKELAWAEQQPTPVSTVPALFAAYHSAKTRIIDGDCDVFGDGSVRILSTPGHTPGSAVLLVSLPASGPVLLTGDLYLTREGRRDQLVSLVNADRADTLASMARFERIARRTHGRVVIQHDPRDYAALPKPPAFLH